MNNIQDIKNYIVPEAERAVLGSILMDNKSYFQINDILKISDFHSPINRVLFENLAEMIIGGEQADLVTLKGKISQDPMVSKIGINTYLSGLLDESFTSVNILSYAKMIKYKSILRRLLSYLEQSGFGSKSEPLEFLQEIEAKISSFSKELFISKDITNEEVIEKVAQDVKQARKSQKPLFGYSTGYPLLDKAITGLRKKETIIIAGRPSQGKTLLALNILTYLGGNEKIASLLLSLEQSHEAIIQRLLSNISGISHYRIRTGQIFDDYEYEKIFLPALIKAMSLPITIDDRPSDLNQIIYKIKRAKNKDNIQVVVIDYLGKIKDIEGDTGNKNNEIGRCLGTIKSLCKELDLNLIILSQLNRRVEYREDKHPILSDLRDSGNLEQEADIVIFLYRDEYYHSETEKKGILEAGVAKGRDCGAGKYIELGFNPEFMRIENLLMEKRDWQDRD